MNPLRRMKSTEQSDKPLGDRYLTTDEVRLIGDLRIMHAKVGELYQLVAGLRQRHSEQSIYKYADLPLLDEDIARVDEIYLWFVKLKDLRKKHA